jgi:hypothetical protein
LIDLAVAFAGTDVLHWLIHQINRDHGPLDAGLRDQALQLADAEGGWAALRVVPGADTVIAAWHARAEALGVYANRLSVQRDPMTVLMPLLRGHHNRMIGVDADSERIVLRLARACALRAVASKPRDAS